jgi:hypothetical protein
MHVLFVAGFSPIVADRSASRAFYGRALDLPLDREEGEYVFSETLAGVNHFGLWPLSQAAQSCFGNNEWPPDVPVPQATIEFGGDRARTGGLHAHSFGQDRTMGSDHRAAP